MTDNQRTSLYKIIGWANEAMTKDGLNLPINEITEQQLFCLIKAMDEIKELVIDIDPFRFGPIKSTSVREQELKIDRLNLCNICGSTRCQSDHK